MSEWANVPTEPVFSFAHVLTPHGPFFYGRDGGSAGSPPCYPASCHLFHETSDGSGWAEAEYMQRMGEHTRRLNQLVLDTVDELIASDPNGSSCCSRITG